MTEPPYDIYSNTSCRVSQIHCRAVINYVQW